MSYLSLIRSYTRYFLYAIVHSFFSGLGQSFLVAFFLPYFRKEFGLNLAQISLFYSAATFTAVAFLPYAGRLIDRMNLRTYSTIVGGLLLSACLTLSLAPNIWVLFGGLVMLRLSGQSLMGHIASTSTSRYFGKHRGKALGIATQGHPLGEAILPLVVTNLFLLFGWRVTLQIISLIFVLIFFPLIYFLLPPSDPFLKPQAKRLEEREGGEKKSLGRRAVLKTPFFYFVLPLATMAPFIATAIFIQQGVLVEFKGWSMQWMATCLVGFASFRILGSFIIGPIVDRVSARHLFPFHLIPMAIGLGILTTGTQPWLGIIFMSFMGLGMGFSVTINNALWAETYGTQYLGAIRSMVLTIVIFSTGVAPILSGWLLSNGWDFNKLCWGSAILIGAASILSTMAPSVKRHTVEAI